MSEERVVNGYVGSTMDSVNNMMNPDVVRNSKRLNYRMLK
jgi:hypothetical protein